MESWHYFDKQPLDPTRTLKWKKMMPAKDKEVTEFISHDLAEEAGYKVSATKPSIAVKFMVLPMRLAAWLAFKLEDWIFYLPLDLKVLIINTYRKLTKTYPQ